MKLVENNLFQRFRFQSIKIGLFLIYFNLKKKTKLIFIFNLWYVDGINKCIIKNKSFIVFVIQVQNSLFC